MSHGATVAKRGLTYAASLPERLVRAAAAGLGGLLHESAQVVLPRFVRASRLYEATAKNALRIAIEAVGGVAPAEPPAVAATYVTSTPLDSRARATSSTDLCSMRDVTRCTRRTLER